ncbi:hypothetical protein [Paenibacillus sp. J22TS3]|uniref:hypothetical protein n=1 Tax=Paenibacillus sp. J22TS3 TaxID=2807192 RepID=UPI001B1321E4|nr:hypothetical protein [Paenibacillus sp. J22TS3]GIP22090.1 hypothetical protein J22TS3_23650 [Paenibacillus sp. J22TS3]
MKKYVVAVASLISMCLLSTSLAVAAPVENRLNKSNKLQSILKSRNETGQDKFLSFAASLDPTIVSHFNIQEDGSVTVNETGLDAAQKEAAFKASKQFEKELKAYQNRINAYNKKLGLNSNEGVKTDGNGGLSFGSGGSGDGTNSFTTNGLIKGDIVLQNDPGTSIQGDINHGGMYDGSSVDVSIYTAQPNQGVKWEAVSEWRRHDEVWGLKTDASSSTEAAAFNKVRADASLGETYYWYAGKGDPDSWYCSKIPWYGYSAMGIELDENGGYWVTPDDLFASSKTHLYNYST